MNNLSLPIKDLGYSVERPVVYDIVRQLMDITEIASKTPIKYAGSESKSLQPNSTIDTKSKINFSNNWPFSERVEIDVIEEYDPDRMLSTVTNTAENYPIFKDTSLDLLMRPMYGVTNVTITLKYRAPDKNAAHVWRNNIKTRVSMGREVNLHSVQYSYHIPDEYIVILKEIHRLRENVAGYGDTFEEYLTNHTVESVGTVSNLNGEEFKYVVSEKQARIQGYFDFSEGVPDKPEKEDDGSAYTTTITYKFTYDKPINFTMIYPFVIHNQLLSKKYREMAPLYTLETRSKSYSLSALSFSKFEDGREILEAYGNSGLDIPSFDYTFLPNSILPGSGRIATILCSITETDKRHLVNLKDLGKFVLNAEVLKYLEYDHANITKNFKSMFIVSLYENNSLKQDNIITIDSDLNVTSTVDLDIRKTYRVRIGLMVNIDIIHAEVLSRLKRYFYTHPDFKLLLFKAINALLKDKGSVGAADSINKSCLDTQDLLRMGMIVKEPYDPKSGKLNNFIVRTDTVTDDLYYLANISDQNAYLAQLIFDPII